jgi:hypothetical protein
MGPVNWVAVVLAAGVAALLGAVWHGPLFRTGRLIPQRGTATDNLGLTVAVMLVGTAMLGHNYARIGADTLALKPWLFWMQSGGIAIAFIIPALWLASARAGTDIRSRLIESGFWLIAYLVIGTVFWALS